MLLTTREWGLGRDGGRDGAGKEGNAWGSGVWGSMQRHSDLCQSAEESGGDWKHKTSRRPLQSFIQREQGPESRVWGRGRLNTGKGQVTGWERGVTKDLRPRVYFCQVKRDRESAGPSGLFDL